MTRSGRQAPAGFTLIELMVVVGIIGLLASVAIPSYTRLLLRTKTAERTTVMYRIRQQVQDYYMRNGTTISPITHPSDTFLVSEFNPDFPPGTAKKTMTLAAAAKPIWAEYFTASGAVSSVPQEIEGALYYSYYFRVQETPTPQIQVWAYGDLDGDGVQSAKTILWNRVNGAYQFAGETPPAGQEDGSTF